MNKLLKTISLFVALVVLCATAAITPAQDEVTLGFVYGSFAPQEKWEAYFEGFLEAHPNVTINYIPVPLDSWGDYTQKIVTTILGGEQVDVIWNAIEAVPLMAERGVLRELDSFLESDSAMQEFLDDVHPKLLEGLRWEDQQYLLPFAWNATLIYYNKSVLEAAGLPEPPPDWTWMTSWNSPRPSLRIPMAMAITISGASTTTPGSGTLVPGWYPTIRSFSMRTSPSPGTAVLSQLRRCSLRAI